MSDTNVIELRQISKHYDAIMAVNNVTLAIKKGESLGLIGHNGAGKSTLFKIMLGLIQPSAGELFWQQQLADEIVLRNARRHVGYLPENLALFDNLTATETLHFFARFKSATQRQQADLLDEVGLTFAAHRRVATFSKGMRQRLGLAQALLGEPHILFLDEPTNGLDPEGVRDLYAAIERRREHGATVVITSHVLAEIEHRVQLLAIVKNGQIAAHGSLQSLRQSQNLPVHIFLSFVSPTAQQNAITVLQQQVGLNVTPRSEQALELCCAPNQKMKVLRDCQQWFTDLLDISVREPRLEDLFFEVQS